MKSKTLVLSIGLPVALLAAALTAAIALGGPGVPPPMPSINDPFKGVSFASLPALSRFTARDGVPLAYRAYAPNITPARGSVVLVHGSSASSNSMHPMAQAFAPAGYAVFALDIRGHGESGTKGRIAYVGPLDADHGDDLEDFVNAVSPPKPAMLAGFSARRIASDRGAYGASLLLQKRFGSDAGLLEDGAQRALWHVAGVVGEGGVPVQRGVEPDFMRTCGLAMELQAQLLQPLDNVSIAEARQRTHQVATISG